MNLRFNIIYTPETVRYLLIFVMSLLRWSDCSFRLVANGCTDEEAEMLKRFTNTSDRLEFYRYPSDDMLPHGTVLTHLQKMEEGEYFCFMDSDIFATGPFMDDFRPLLSGYDGVFSCLPEWCSDDDRILHHDFPRVKGVHYRHENGHFLGVTYFAIYRNTVLKDFFRRHPVSFDRYVRETVHPEYREYLEGIALMKERYDTGKLLNILLQREGGRLTYLHSDRLCHFSGFSGVSMKIREGRVPAVFSEEKYTFRNRLKSMLSGLFGKEDNALPALDESKRPVFHVRRIKINEYLKELLYCLHDGKRFRGELLDIDDPFVVGKVSQMRAQLENLFKEHYAEYSRLVKGI